jgi:ketosteroid isomerase-like protein
MTDAEDIAELLRLKEAALDASARGDADFYAGYLADDAIAITPRGIADKAAVVAAAAVGGFRSLGVDDVRAWKLGPDTGAVSYVARFPAGEGAERRVLTCTVYRREADGRWSGVIYQQTPLA